MPSTDATIRIRTVSPADRDAWVRMRVALWPEGSAAEHDAEAERFLRGLSRDPLAVLVAEDAHGGLVGFAEMSIRAYAEGCVTDRVGYLEGWFVEPAARGRGVGRALVTAAEGWARSQGCSEFASDTEADNHASALAHRALGFAEAGMIRCFRKDLSPAHGEVSEELRQKASELFDASIRPILTSFLAGDLTSEAAAEQLAPLLRPLGVWALNVSGLPQADAPQTVARLGELLEKLTALGERLG